MGIITILWEKWREFIRDFSRITLAAMVAPLMYLIVFGWGIRTTMNGQPYLYFLIPGVISLTTMNGSFNAIAQNLNVQRLYEKAFDQVIISLPHSGNLSPVKSLPVPFEDSTLAASSFF